MEKLYFTGGIKTLNDPVFNVLRLLQEKENEIVEWINENKKAIEWVNEFQKMFYDAFEQILLQYKAGDIVKNKQKQEPKSTIAGKPQVLRYKLSNDKVGLVAYLRGEISYHIHSDELTPEQLQIRNQLLEMEKNA